MMPELRPRGIGEILDTGVALYRERFGPLIKVTLAVVIPLEILSALVQLSAQPDEYTVGVTGIQPVYDESEFLLQIAALFVILGVQTMGTAFVTAAATRISADAYVGNAEDPATAVRNVGRRFFALVGLSIVVTLGVLVGFLLCIVPGLVLIALWSVAVPVLVLEGTGISAALGRSWKLASAYFWITIGAYWTVQLLSFALTFGIAALLGLFLTTSDSSTGAVITQSVANAVSAVITTPLIATVLVALYFDLRIRAEGFDVQMMLMRLDSRRTDAPGDR